MRIRSLIFIIVLGGVLLLLSCSDVTKPGDAARIQINRLLDDFEDAVYNYRVEDITAHIHRDFLHNGRERGDQVFIWMQRLLLFDQMYLQERTIEVNGIAALASFRMTLSGADSTVVSQEPSAEYGDISYFIRDEGRWQLYGNQLY